MAKKVLYDDNTIFLYENLLNLSNLRFQNSKFTVSSLPDNFRFIENPNSPATVVTKEEPESVSLVV
jgi:hypothetical protein